MKRPAGQPSKHTFAPASLVRPRGHVAQPVPLASAKRPCVHVVQAALESKGQPVQDDGSPASSQQRPPESAHEVQLVLPKVV